MTYEDKYILDLIASFAWNLAESCDDAGRSTAGLKIEYFQHLSADFQSLDSYGGYIRKTMGESLKRKIHFCDDSEALYKDVLLPDDDNWMWINTDMEMEVNSRKNTQNTIEI